MNFFDSVEYLEPRCENCGKKIDWGVTTEYHEEYQSHVCRGCGAIL